MRSRIVMLQRKIIVVLYERNLLTCSEFLMLTGDDYHASEKITVLQQRKLHTCP